MPKRIDWIGARVGKLTIVRDGPMQTEGLKHPIRTFITQCDCGSAETLYTYKQLMARPHGVLTCGVCEHSDAYWQRMRDEDDRRELAEYVERNKQRSEK